MEGHPGRVGGGLQVLANQQEESQEQVVLVSEDKADIFVSIDAGRGCVLCGHPDHQDTASPAVEEAQAEVEVRGTEANLRQQQPQQDPELGGGLARVVVQEGGDEHEEVRRVHGEPQLQRVDEEADEAVDHGKVGVILLTTHSSLSGSESVNLSRTNWKEQETYFLLSFPLAQKFTLFTNDECTFLKLLRPKNVPGNDGRP